MITMHALNLQQSLKLHAGSYMHVLQKSKRKGVQLQQCFIHMELVKQLLYQLVFCWACSQNYSKQLYIITGLEVPLAWRRGEGMYPAFPPLDPPLFSMVHKCQNCIFQLANIAMPNNHACPLQAKCFSDHMAQLAWYTGRDQHYTDLIISSLCRWMQMQGMCMWDMYVYMYSVSQDHNIHEHLWGYGNRRLTCDLVRAPLYKNPYFK